LKKFATQGTSPLSNIGGALITGVKNNTGITFTVGGNAYWWSHIYLGFTLTPCACAVTPAELLYTAGVNANDGQQ
jgi:hypothetical protein